jgi:phenylalanyl-tRNA synthetase beta chain
MNILIPDRWLRDYLQTDATPKQIKECLSLCGASIERINQVPDDFIYDIEITSNRVDMASVYGIAREAAAILPRFNIPAKLIKPEIIETDIPKNTLPFELLDPDKICNRILACILEVDMVKKAPDYMKERIEKSGIRSLNSLVDITNYVMLELGHPCHVFDYDRIKTHKFIIRYAKNDEQIITLDQKVYKLSNNDVIIDDGTGQIIDLPGIMGTQNSVVTNDTKRIIFFIESNNPVLIRKTSIRYGIRTMAATINEKHPDPELAKTALFRGIDLYKKEAGGKVKSKIYDLYPVISTPLTVKTTYSFINNRIGVNIKNEDINSILESLNFKVHAKDNFLEIIPPTYRQFDITIPEDIVEEVARMYGYFNLPSEIMEGKIPANTESPFLSLELKVKTMLKYFGLTEIYNYSFISGDMILKSSLDPKKHIKVTNPLTSETEYMRISLLPSLLETVRYNQNLKEKLELFELSKIYLNSPGSLPKEKLQLVISNQDNFYILKGIVEQIFEEVGIKTYSQLQHTANFFHPKQTVSLNIDNDILAIIGTANPAITNKFEINDKLFIAEIDMDNLVKYSSNIKKYKHISLYPPVVEDLTFVLNSKVTYFMLTETISKTDPLITKLEMISKFEDSITIKITYQNNTGNLSNEEVGIIRSKIAQNVKKQYGIRIKGLN